MFGIKMLTCSGGRREMASVMTRRIHYTAAAPASACAGLVLNRSAALVADIKS